MAKMISVFAGRSEGNGHAAVETTNLTWSETALALLDRAPDKLDVLKKFVRHLRPMTWSGSRAAIMETRLPLLKKLEQHSDAALAGFAKADGERLKKEIEQEKRYETEQDRSVDETFE